MAHPWLSISSHDYDAHLSHPSCGQRQFLDRVLADALARYTPRSVMIPGAATGGGFDLIDPETTPRVTAVDFNPEYLKTARERYAERLPQVEWIAADLETCDLAETYDLIFCALVLEYVDAEVVLPRLKEWLSPTGRLMIVLQLASMKVEAVSETGCDSLQALKPVMRLSSPDELHRRAIRSGLVELESVKVELKTGKQFFIGTFRKRPETRD